MSPLFEYRAVIDGIYGVYLDATHGFSLALSRIGEVQRENLKLMPDMTQEKLDQASYVYGMGDPNLPGARELHTCTQAEIKRRNAKGGPNYAIIANLCVVLLYQYWEDQFRGEIAQVLFGINKDDLKSDLLGDLRLIRNAIVHHRGVATAEISKCKVLHWFSPGDTVVIGEARFDEIILGLKRVADDLERKSKTSARGEGATHKPARSW